MIKGNPLFCNLNLKFSLRKIGGIIKVFYYFSIFNDIHCLLFLLSDRIEVWCHGEIVLRLQAQERPETQNWIEDGEPVTVKLWNFVRNFDINIHIFLNAFHILCKYLHENMINDIYLIFFPLNLLISLTPTTSHSLQINFYELCSFINTPQSLKRLSCASSEGHHVSVFVLEGCFWTINEESSLHLRFTFNEVFLT